MVHRICSGIGLSILCCCAGAEGVLETLVVTAPAIVNDTVLSANRINNDTATLIPGLRIDSAEILQRLPGVQADSRSNYAQDTRVTLRGFGARSAFGVRGIDLMLDGIPLTTPDGQGQLSSVSLDGVASVELLRGPLAALYGNGAGGVISMQTQAPDSNRLGVRLFAGENDTQRQALHGDLQQDNLGVRFHASQFTAEGDRPHASAERQQTGAQFYVSSQQGIEAVVRIDSSRDPSLEDPLALTPEQWRDDPQQINPTAELFNTRKAIAHQQASFTLRQATGERRWQLQGWRGERSITQYLGFSGASATSAGGVVDLARDFYGLSGNYNIDFFWRDMPMTATFGAELSAMDDERKGFVNAQGVAGDLRRQEVGEVDSHDLYSIVQLQPSTRWQWYVGARFSALDFGVDDSFITATNPDDSGKKQFSEWSSATGVSYDLTDNWQFFASVGRGFETPTLTEMAYRTDTSGLNIALDAAHNYQQEIGISFNPSASTTASLTAFSVASHNEILVDQSLGGRTTYRNAAATERQGLELTSEWAITKAWLAWINLNYLEANYSQGEWSGNRLPGVARNNHTFQLRWQPLLNEQLAFTLLAQYRSRVATADENKVFAPAATTVDFAVSSHQAFGCWELSAWLKLANLNDARYVGSVIVNQANGRSFEPAAGRNLHAGLEVNIYW